MLLSTRIAILVVMLLQLPLFYCAILLGTPVEQPLTAYGAGGSSWLYYLGRPATTLLGVIFGFFSDLHYSFRYICFVAVLLAIVLDSLSEAQVSERLECLTSGRCPQRNPWAAPILQMYIARDAVGLVADVWTLLLIAYLMTYIGFYRPYYSYRQLTVGEFNRILKLQEVYATYFEDLYDTYFGADEQDMAPQLRSTLSRHKMQHGGKESQSGRKRNQAGLGVGIDTHVEFVTQGLGHGQGEQDAEAGGGGLDAFQGSEAVQLRESLLMKSAEQGGSAKGVRFAKEVKAT